MPQPKMKQPRGRPATGIKPLLAVRVTAEFLARVDRSAENNFEQRRHAVRRLLARALDAEGTR